MNKLRITADDFGCTHSINEAIEILHKIGIVNYAAIMVQGDEIDEAIKIAKRNNRLSIGLHFTITDELSLSKRNSITDNNFNLFPRKKLLIRCSTLRIKKKDVEIELENQINFLKENDINISFINGHQHGHTLPIISEVILDYAKKNNLYVRSINQKYRKDNDAFINVYNILKYIFYARFNRLLRKKNIKTNNLLISSFNTSNQDYSLNGIRKSFSAINKEIKYDIIEYMVHPAATISGLKRYWYNDNLNLDDRVSEFNSLCDKDFEKICNDNNCQII